MQTEELKTLNSDSLSEKARYHIDTIQKSRGDEEAGTHLRTRASELRTARRQDLSTVASDTIIHSSLASVLYESYNTVHEYDTASITCSGVAQNTDQLGRAVQCLYSADHRQEFAEWERAEVF